MGEMRKGIPNEEAGMRRVIVSCLNLEVFEDVDPASTAEVGGGAGEGVLLQAQVHHSDHEAQLDRKTRETVGGKVKEGELEVS